MCRIVLAIICITLVACKSEGVEIPTIKIPSLDTSAARLSGSLYIDAMFAYQTCSRSHVPFQMQYKYGQTLSIDEYKSITEMIINCREYVSEIK